MKKPCDFKKTITFGVICILLVSCLSQDKEPFGELKNISYPTYEKGAFNLKIKLKNKIRQKIILLRFSGLSRLPVDSAEFINDEYVFEFPENFSTGLYVLSSNGKELPVVINHENISLSVPDFSSVDSVIVLASVENKLFYQFQKLAKKIISQKEILQGVVSKYPSARKQFYNEARKELDGIVRIEKEMYQVLENFEGTFTHKYLKFMRPLSVHPHLTKSERVAYLRRQLLSGKTFTDLELQNSNAYTLKSLEYLYLHKEEADGSGQQLVSYQKAIDELMDKTNGSPESMAFMYRFLSKGFEKLDFEEILSYLSNKYLSAISCLDDSQLTDYHSIKEGVKAPIFNLKDLEGKKVKSEFLKSDFKLLIFWSSTCPHCHRLLDQLKVSNLVKEERVTIVAISIDETEQIWSNFLNQKQYSWINLYDNGGIVSRKYGVYATPTLFLIGKDHVVVKKSITLDDILLSF